MNGYQPTEFLKYSNDQFVTILERRIERDVRPDIISDEVVETIINVPRNDAHKAIGNLRKVVRLKSEAATL